MGMKQNFRIPKGIRIEIIDDLKGSLFVDPDFIYTNNEEISWKRPFELVEAGQKPELFVGEVCKKDVLQGNLGDCWFLSACAAISHHSMFMNKVLPPNQSLYGENYSGLLHFRFWRFGTWKDVVIDDLLPVKYGKLHYARCLEENEFWLPLLEKAYAKIHDGQYANIEGGFSKDALVDLTGGISEKYSVKEMEEANLFKYLLRAYKSDAFVTCSAKKGETDTENVGLLANHTYTVTQVEIVRDNQKNKIRLFRIRNPWGNGKEWTGSWSDSSIAWQTLSHRTREILGQRKEEDGEFWMSLPDFISYFTEVTICTLGPDFNADGSADLNRKYDYISGKWIKGKSAGGCINNMDTFCINPQFCLTIFEDSTDAEDEIEDGELERGTSFCHYSVLIALMQIDDSQKGRPVENRKKIGFCLYKVDEPKRLDKEYLLYNRDIGDSGDFTNWREVCARFTLETGNYIIIPSTFHQNQEASFLIRVFSQKIFKLTAL
ncbi:DgyrCDS12417 [Dimorphilus gyrociliatus]|uniref:DgyrCDS12417 n=1 Tax=Dimorphilus gyrociliatus TaxID=2664684 RepID=A0A7I8W8K2_9ANNE|nr:DgyrCDS12417 [Dimorphilus gyrociliatus]